MRFSSNNSRGVSAIEVVIGVSIVALVILFSINAIVSSITIGADQVERTRAVYLAEEALEVMRFLHDENWADITALSNGTPYYMDISPTAIAVDTTPVLIDGTFSQTVTLTDVYRRTSDDDIIASTSGSTKYIDPDTRLVTATVSWGTATSTVSLEAYLSNIDP